MLQIIILTLVVVGAVGYVVRYIVRSFLRRKAAITESLPGACGGCSQADTNCCLPPPPPKHPPIL